MNGPALLLLLTACVLSGADVPKAVWQFGNMIKCVQPGANPLAYNNYGCWCGIGGNGTPMDELDECCYTHDKCYEASRKIPGCTSLSNLPHILVYAYTCFNGEVQCSGTNDVCQAAACECDREAAYCFAQSPYNPEYVDLDHAVCVD
ncbi:phospholipase A2-like [Kryptolebias marmoratus]|uniref:Phospholipase A2 n=1 Tax=Kryptolebias marmoratus TaxID=37003 RepID=A0A3Q3AEX1_KRYMA|nr:phospholipase A2-like [Kryptolebias marmoratus]